MKYLVIEDEVPAQRLVRELLRELRPGWEAAACLDSVEDAVNWLNSHPHPHIVFMDIQLSDGSSFEILEQVDIKGMIIFTTAYDEYALRAFKANSIDYLLKPLKKGELAKALDKYERFAGKADAGRKRAMDAAELAAAIRGAEPRYRTRFLVSLGEVFSPLPLEKVAYIYSRHRVTSAVSFAGKRFVVDFTLDRLEEELDPEVFFRVSRGFIVNINAVFKVHAFFNGKLVLETRPPHDEKVIISREKARLFKPWLDR